MKVTILSTSDIHGYIYPTDFRKKNQSLPFGATKVKNLMKKIEKKNQGPLVKIDNGDFLQGSPLSYYIAKKGPASMISEMMNALEFDAGVLGNHEFNYGLDYLKEVIAGLNYPILCANILNADGTPLTGHSHIILEKEGVKIGLLGLTTPYIPNWEQPTVVKDLIFKSAVATAKEYVPMLRELCDIVVVSYHGGFERDLDTGEPTESLTGENEGYELLNEVAGIDVLLTGHQHREIEYVTETCAVTQPGDKGRFIGKVILDYDKNDKSIKKRDAKIIPMEIEEDNTMHQQFLPYLNEVEQWLDKKIGEVHGDMVITDPMAVRSQGHPYIEFIQAVQMAATNTDISGTALFDNNGTGFDKEITMRGIVTNYIYPNTLAVVRVTGQELQAALERSASYFTISESGELEVSDAFLIPKTEHYNYDLYAGIDYTMDIRRPKGHRVTRFIYHGEPVQDTQLLDVVVNQYRAVGGGDYTMFGAEKIIREVTVDMTELILDYLQKQPVIETKETTNFEILY